MAIYLFREHRISSESTTPVSYTHLDVYKRQVQHCFVLFYYDIFPKSRELMAEIGINLH